MLNRNVFSGGVNRRHRLRLPHRLHLALGERDECLGSSGRRNTREEVAMSKRKRNSDRAGRGLLWSPGRPGVERR